MIASTFHQYIEIRTTFSPMRSGEVTDACQYHPIKRARVNGPKSITATVPIFAEEIVKLVHAVATAIFAQTFIYLGLIFMAGKLFPTVLAPIYHLFPTPGHRLLFSTATIMLAGNLLFQRLYNSHSVLIAGIASTISGILIVNAGGLIIEKRIPSVPMVAGILLLIVGAFVCIYARTRV